MRYRRDVICKQSKTILIIATPNTPYTLLQQVKAGVRNGQYVGVMKLAR